MTPPLYRTPMSGDITVHWQLTVDEDGEPQGFIGTPNSEETVYGDLDDYAGSEIGFAVSLPGIDDESMAASMQAAVIIAVGRHIAPRIIKHMYQAAIELRGRQGGFDQTLYDERMAELRAEWEEAQGEDQSDTD